MSTTQGLTLALKRNTKWAPNGPMDYARSARKWNIKPTDQTTFFTHEQTLFRRAVPPSTAETEETEEHPTKRRSFLAGLFGSEKKKHHHGQGGPTSGGGTVTVPGGSSGSTHTGAEVPAEDVQQDLEYVVPVIIGTPGIRSADLWVWSSLLHTTAANSKGHTIYDPTKSSTAKIADGEKWNISYGDGSGASGTVYTDTVKLDTLTIPNQAVETANKLSSQFLTEGSSDGLLGLAFPSINTISPTPKPTPVQNAITQSLLASPLFTAKLDKGDSNGFYTFGYIADASDSGALGEIVYVDVDSSNGFWEFPSTSLKIGSKTVARPRGNTAIADTGTTLILLDDDTVSAIYSSIEGATLDNETGGWVLPTSSTPSAISFSVDSSTEATNAGVNYYEISGEDLKFADAGNGMSFGSIQSRGQNPQDILGDVFLKRVYAIFDQTPGAPRIGFSQRALA